MIDEVKKLKVKYNGRDVGMLAQVGSDKNKIAFQYDNEWLKNGFSISPYSLPLKDEIFVNSRQEFGGLYGVFNDSLPDGWGELVARRMLIKQDINPDKLSPLTKLTLLSSNGLGGLVYEPCQIEESDSFEFNFDKLYDEIKLVLEEKNEQQDLDMLFKMGGSSGGARPKAHLKIDNDYWIIKFPLSFEPMNVGINEFEANERAKQCGINVNEHKLFESKICEGYFGAKRFDRVGEKRIHMISLASLLEISHRTPIVDYGHLFQTIQDICVNKEDLMEAYKRMCFNVLYGNKDDHSKNFAFLYDEKLHSYKLSPAYDITKTPNKFEHEMTVNRVSNPTLDDLLQLAIEFDLPLNECKKIIEDIKFICKTK